MLAEAAATGFATKPGRGQRSPRSLKGWALALSLLGLVSASLAFGEDGSPAPSDAASDATANAEASFFREVAEPLGLTDEQVRRLEAISAESRKYAKEIKTELLAARADLHELLEQDEPELMAVMTIADEIGVLETRRRKHHLTTLLSMRALLTSEQRADLMPVFRETNKRKRAAAKAGKIGDAAPRAAATGDRAENSP